MTLGTHAAVGAVVAEFIPTHPVLGFGLGFASHFLLDSLPHWDYPLASRVKDRANPLNDDVVVGRHFRSDLVSLALDVALGISITVAGFVILGLPWHGAFIWGALGGLLPDALQFVYFKLRWPSLRAIQSFHLWIHAARDLNERPVLGIMSQLAIVGLLFALKLEL